MRLPHIVFANDNPVYRPLDEEDYMGAYRWRLEEPYSFVVNGYCVRIEAGFEWEPSIPRGFWNTFPPQDPDFCAPTLLHDWAGEAEVWSYRFNDRCFLASLKFRGVKRWKRAAMYVAVRVGGNRMHRKRKPHTPESVAHARSFCPKTAGLTQSPLWHNGTTVII